MPYVTYLLVALAISVWLGFRSGVFRRPVVAISSQRKDWATKTVLLVGGAGLCAQVQAAWGWIGVVIVIALTVAVIWVSPAWSWGRRN